MSFGRPRGHNPLNGTQWRHRKTGRRYEIVRIGLIEETLELVVIYEDIAGHVWVRPHANFMDGCFEQLHPPAQENLCSEILMTGEPYGKA